MSDTRDRDSDSVQVRIEASPQQTATSTTESNGDMRAMFVAMQQQMLQMQQQMAQMQMSRSNSRRSVSETLHTVQSERAGEYSASAAVQQPPVLQHRRESMGFPSYAFTPGPVATPRPAAARPYAATTAPRMQSLDEGKEEVSHLGSPVRTAAAAVQEATDDGLPAYDERMHHVKKAMIAVMKPFPFHGQPDVDKLNVLSWVEKIDTEFSINMGTRQAGRLDIVRSLLAGPALLWMNDKVRDLTRKAERGELSEEIEWATMRAPFIDQHLGVNTIETFKAQLRALRLGSSSTPTPVELNQEFDRLAALAYPSHQSDLRETVLGDEYGTIIASSNSTIYRSVAYTNYPGTLDEWKLHVSRRWAAGKNVEAVEARVRGMTSTSRPHGGWRGRGGRTGNGNAGQQLNAVAGETEDGAGEEGAPHDQQVQAAPQQQLNAAAGPVNGQRGGGGGRGGRGGRGRGGGESRGGEGRGMPASLTEEQKKWWSDNACLKCGQQGHRARGCLKA